MGGGGPQQPQSHATLHGQQSRGWCGRLCSPTPGELCAIWKAPGTSYGVVAWVNCRPPHSHFAIVYLSFAEPQWAIATSSLWPRAEWTCQPDGCAAVASCKAAPAWKEWGLDPCRGPWIQSSPWDTSTLVAARMQVWAEVLTDFGYAATSAATKLESQLAKHFCDSALPFVSALLPVLLCSRTLTWFVRPVLANAR